jgi:peptidoglycan/xylan/chitin deacetylase (PgdA/CDA1 family)
MNQKPHKARVLIYHKINEDPVDSQLLAVTPTHFKHHLEFLKEYYDIICLDELVTRMKTNKFSGNEVTITFDDGYLDNYTNMLPIIEDLNVPVTIFIATDSIGSEQEFWWDQVEQMIVETKKKNIFAKTCKTEFEFGLSNSKQKLSAIDRLCAEYKKFPHGKILGFLKQLRTETDVVQQQRNSHKTLSKDELISFTQSRLITIGSHTKSHTRLSILSKESQFSEIIESKDCLENILKKPVKYLSYPYGSRIDFSTTTEELILSNGFSAGIANIQDDLQIGNNITSIPRRLVRDWNLDQFASWMQDPDKSNMETCSLQLRSQKLDLY